MQWKALAMLGLAPVAAGCAPEVVGPHPTQSTAAGPSYSYGGTDPASFSTTWFQGFEVDAIDWNGTILRVPSGTNGVTSSGGSFHAEVGSGAFTRFNAYSSVWPGNYTAEIDVYLDPAWAVGQGFDYSVATNGTTNVHRRDFIFHVGVVADGRLLVNGSNNSDGTVNDYILEHDGDGTPYQVTTAGWYKLQHVFYDAGGGVLAVDLRLLNSSGTQVFTTTRSDPTDVIGSTVGGHRYGWFVFTTRTLAIDNQRLAVDAAHTPTTVNLTITPSSAVFDAKDVNGVASDAATGFASGSFASGGTNKTDMYFTPQALFGREVSVGEVARMSYWTKKGTTHTLDPADWFMAIYTQPFAGDVSTPSWYGSRFGAEPYFSANIVDPANTWNLWSTNVEPNRLRFFESTAGAPGATFGSYTDPDWATFIADNSLGTSVQRASQKVLFFSIQTGSAWAAGFTGKLDGLRVELGDGSVATVNFEPDDDQAPVVTNVAVTPNPAPYTTSSYTLTADATDNVAVTAASYTIDGGSSVAFTGITAGASVSLSASLGPLAIGVHNVCVTASDAATNTSTPPECTMLAVYDPNAGFVTGGGWLNSPAGAYSADPSLSGRANFGFVSKYKKGATIPDGNTEFQFQAAALSFHSTSYQWLVVNKGGLNAQFKGVGQLNGIDGYNFMIWATDRSKLDGSTDTFRIQITDAGGNVIYDNGVEQAIAGGSIVVQTGK